MNAFRLLPGPVRTTLRLARNRVLSARAFNELREPKAAGGLKDSPEQHKAILADLRWAGFDVRSFQIDVAGYREYLHEARYERFDHYYAGGRARNFPEKALEHYVSAVLLALHAGDTYIDVASCNSPTATIYQRLYGCTTYRQDLSFPEGLHGNTIGSDAAQMPLPDGFATAIGLHCSFEHFEGDSDRRFINEARRVLRPGGRLCILPLYLHTYYAILTNPLYGRTVCFEPDAMVHGDWTWPERHGRAYDVSHLHQRVRLELKGMCLIIYIVENAREAFPGSYLRYAALIHR